jgi:alcohol dehydrogenase class IV
MYSTYLVTNPILFGRGSSMLVGEKTKEFGCKKVLVVYDQGVKAAGITDKILGSLHATGIETIIFDNVQADPPDWSVEEAAELGIKENVDGVVSVGGGSSIDTGKAALWRLSNEGPINRYFLKPGQPPLPTQKPLKPIIIIPTTAETGTEASPGGAITDTKTNQKMVTEIPVSLGLIDPELTLRLPPGVTASTGLDAFSHAIEAYTSIAANKINDVLAEKSISLIGKYLRTAVNEGSNIEAREGVMLAATLGGMSMMGPYCHFAHDIGMPLGTIFHIPYGIACAAFQGESMEFIADAVPEKVKFIAEALGAKVPAGVASEEIGKICKQAIYSLMKDTKLPSLKNYIKGKDELLATIPKVMEFAAFMFSPKPVSKDDAVNLIVRAYEAY